MSVTYSLDLSRTRAAAWRWMFATAVACGPASEVARSPQAGAEPRATETAAASATSTNAASPVPAPAGTGTAAPVALVLPPAPPAPSATVLGTPLPPPAPFRPADFSPPYARSAASGDGQWTAMGDAARGEPAAAEPRLMYRTTVHPHKISRFISIDLVAIDLRRLKPHWVLGKKDQGADEFAQRAPLGLVPEAQRGATYAVFNGGFLARHGRWGMMGHGLTIVPPRDIGCTLATFDDGSVRIAPWRSMPREGLLSYRQAAPCLLLDQQIHPNLLKGNSRLWAGQHPTRKTRRRSAVGIDAKGEVLFYAVGTETEAIDLARGMLAGGASQAMQLDINWNWTRFLIVGRRDDGQPRITSTLIDDMVHGKNEYFSYPSDRDFFYLASVDASAHLPNR